MTVKDLLDSRQTEVITTTTETSMKEAMRLLIDNNISCLPITEDDGTLLGIISDKDIFRKVYETGGGDLNFAVGELMSRDLIIGLPNDDVRYIAGLMTNNRIRHIPVVAADKLIGLVSIGDVVKTQMKDMSIENRYLKSYIEGTYPG